VVLSFIIVVIERLGDVESHNRRIGTLEKLTEARQLVIHAIPIEKMRRKSWYDKTIIHENGLHDGDLALLYNSKRHKGKLNLIGDGPCIVHHINENKVVLLKTLEGAFLLGYINGSRIKRSHAPILT